MALVCTPAVPCNYHRDGGPKRHKCYGMCDRRGCREPIDTSEPGARYCDAHARRRPIGHPVTTGSKETPVVSFRLSAADYQEARAIAESEGRTVNELAMRALVARVAEARRRVIG